MKPDNRPPKSSNMGTFKVVREQPYIFLKIKLDIEDEDVDALSVVQYKFLIMQAVKETIGQVGASTPIDLLKLHGNGISLLRIPSRNAEKVWAALTLYGKTPSQKRCAIRVLQASSTLMGLAFDSRNLR